MDPGTGMFDCVKLRGFDVENDKGRFAEEGCDRLETSREIFWVMFGRKVELDSELYAFYVGHELDAFFPIAEIDCVGGF